MTQEQKGQGQGQVFWKCPACNFEAKSEQEKRNHLREKENDPKHMQMEEMVRE